MKLIKIIYGYYSKDEMEKHKDKLFVEENLIPMRCICIPKNPSMYDNRPLYEVEYVKMEHL